MFAVNAFAADALTERLQRGLFEEEANRDLDAAIKEYQSVVTQADEQRKVVATALFRLGECYRKLGRTNDAAAFYQRIVRDFSEQEQLVKLAADFLKPAIAAAPAGNPSELVRELQRRAAMLKVESMTALMEYDRLTTLTPEQLAHSSAATNSPALAQLQPQLLVTEQKLVMLKEQQQLGDGHPEVKAMTALQKTIRQQYDETLKGILTAAQQRADSLAAQLRVVDEELKKAGAATTETPRAATEATSLTQAEAEELARVKTLARNSPDLLNAPDRGSTELQKAARAGHYSVTEFLLSQGVKANAPVQNNSALVEAAQRGHLRIVQLLLDHGATKEDATEGLLSACASGFKSVAELLLTRGADMNGRSIYGHTPLHFAARGGHVAVVEMLLKRGAQPDVLAGIITADTGFPGWSTFGSTPLHFAAEKGFVTVAKLLLDAGAKAGATNYAGRTPLHVAATSGHTNLAALLLDRGADINARLTDGMTPLVSVLLEPNSPSAFLLVTRGADLNQVAFAGNPLAYPLHIAVDRHAPPLLQAMLATKPNLEVINNQDWTPLQYAIAHNFDAKAELLLEAGASPNRSFWDGATLLHNASSGGRVALVRALLKSGAKPNVVNQRGETPLSLALGAIQQMSFRGAPNSFSTPAGGGPGIVAFSEPINAPNSNSSRPPTKPDYEGIVTLLKEHGADEFLQRRGFISAVRGPQQRVNIFFKGTNNVNRYTLMEFLAAVYEQGGKDFPFPDLEKITIHRVSTWKGPVTNLPTGVHSVNAMATVNAKTPILVNFAALLAATNCAGDVPLEWGDEVEIPMADHSVNANWPGMVGRSMNDAGQGKEAMIACLLRRVRFTAGGISLTNDLSPYLLDLRTGRNPVPRQPFFRLSATVLRADRFRNLLRSSSDLSRVTVTRTDPQTKETKKMTFDLNAVALPDMSYSSGNQPPIPWAHDLWLRDGDAIEVPEKP